jgi:membrane protease YdiL (CAAX protease family)
VFLYCVTRRRNFTDLGFNRPGTAFAWIAVLAAQAGLIWFDATLGPVGAASGLLSPYALAAAAIVGPCAAFAEETFFRGFLMEELRRGGFGVALQCVISGIFFGLAHFSYVAGPGGWSIPVFTGLLGVFWSFIYILGKRSLWPTIVAHVINDAVLIPSVFYLILSHAHG